MKKIIILIVALIGLLSFLLFHTQGNAILKPYLAGYIEKQLDHNHSIDIQHLKIDMDYLEITALLDENTEIQAQGNSNVLDKSLDLNYTLSSTGFSHKEFTFQRPLKLEGNAQGKFHDLKIIGKGSTLDSKVHYTFKLKDKKVHNLDLNMKDAEIATLLSFMEQPSYATGKADLNLSVPEFNTKTPNAKTSIKLYNVHLNESTFKERFALDLPPKTKVSGDIKAQVISEHMHLETDLQSNLASLKLSKGTLNLNSKKFLSHYQLHIPELSKLQYLVEKPLQGTLELEGEMKYHKSLHLTGTTKSFGGAIDFELINQDLKSQLKSVSVEKLMYLGRYPQIFQAKLNGTLEYDLLHKKGKFNSTLKQARLLKNTLTELVQQVRGIDLTKERYNESHLNATIHQERIDLDFQAKSKQVRLSIPSGEINKAQNTIKADYTVSIENIDLSGEIHGQTSNPKITIDSSKFIQEEVGDILKDNLDEERLKEFGIGEKETEIIKNIFGDLFK